MSSGIKLDGRQQPSGSLDVSYIGDHHRYTIPEYTAEDMVWAIQTGGKEFSQEDEMPNVVETQLKRAKYGMDTEDALDLIDVIEEEAGFSELCNEYRKKAR
jgi:uncharacterized Fe-S cluster-containing protein